MLITIGHYLNPIQAHIVRGRLEVEGIRAFVHHEHHVWAKWTISLALGYVKVQVFPTDLQAAVAGMHKLDAGEYSLPEDGDDHTSQCPHCGQIGYDRVDWSWKLALWAAIAFSLITPYSLYRVRCTHCGHHWTQEALRSYPLWITAFAIMLITSGFLVLERAFYYICKINYINAMCI